MMWGRGLVDGHYPQLSHPNPVITCHLTKQYTKLGFYFTSHCCAGFIFILPFSSPLKSFLIILCSFNSFRG